MDRFLYSSYRLVGGLLTLVITAPAVATSLIAAFLLSDRFSAALAFAIALTIYGTTVLATYLSAARNLASSETELERLTTVAELRAVTAPLALIPGAARRMHVTLPWLVFITPKPGTSEPACWGAYLDWMGGGVVVMTDNGGTDLLTGCQSYFLFHELGHCSAVGSMAAVPPLRVVGLRAAAYLPCLLLSDSWLVRVVIVLLFAIDSFFSAQQREMGEVTADMYAAQLLFVTTDAATYIRILRAVAKGFGREAARLAAEYPDVASIYGHRQRILIEYSTDKMVERLGRNPHRLGVAAYPPIVAAMFSRGLGWIAIVATLLTLQAPPAILFVPFLFVGLTTLLQSRTEFKRMEFLRARLSLRLALIAADNGKTSALIDGRRSVRPPAEVQG